MEHQQSIRYVYTTVCKAAYNLITSFVSLWQQQIPAANTASGGQFPKPSYSTGYGSTSYDALSQASQDYTKGAYPSSVNQQTKSQNVANPPQTGTSSDITSSMYSKGHVALNKVNVSLLVRIFQIAQIVFIIYIFYFTVI